MARTYGRGQRTRAQRLNVARAALEGLRRRLADIEIRRDLTPEQKARQRAEVLQEIRKREERIAALEGGSDLPSP